MGRPNHLICHLISCPVFPAAFSIPNNNTTPYFTLLIINYSTSQFPVDFSDPVLDITAFTVLRI
jgi:hypothetical protein